MAHLDSGQLFQRHTEQGQAAANRCAIHTALHACVAVTVAVQTRPRLRATVYALGELVAAGLALEATGCVLWVQAAPTYRLQPVFAHTCTCMYVIRMCLYVATYICMYADGVERFARPVLPCA